MPKSKTRNQPSKQQREVRRFQKTSKDIVGGLLGWAFDEKVLLSIHQETDTPEGLVFTPVVSLHAHVDEDGTIYVGNITDGIKTVDHKAFIEILAKELTSKTKKRRKLSMVYFDVEPEAKRLIIPAYEEVLQWEITNGTIIPDNEDIPLWELLVARPGFTFEYGEFDVEKDLQSYLHNHIDGLDGLEVSERFLKEIVEKSSNGHHVITIVGDMDGDEKIIKTLFVKDEGELYVNTEYFEVAMQVLGLLMEAEVSIGVTLRSFTEKTMDDAFEMDSSTQEVRGWSIQGDDIEQLFSDELIDAYCTDAATGKFLSPEPYVKYCDTWESTTKE